MAKTKAGKNNRESKVGNVPSDTVRYTGPIRTESKGMADDSIIVTLSAAFSVSGGVVGLQMSTGSDGVSSCNDWGRYAGLYDEYRVLGFEQRFLPHYRNGSTTVTHSAGFACSTHAATNPGPFTSIMAAVEYDWREVNTSQSFTTQWKMNSTEEAQFGVTASPVAQGWINAFLPNATSTGSYGYCVNVFRIQFRGRK
jgi:hypothetical protein